MEFFRSTEPAACELPELEGSIVSDLDLPAVQLRFVSISTPPDRIYLSSSFDSSSGVKLDNSGTDEEYDGQPTRPDDQEIGSSDLLLTSPEKDPGHVEPGTCPMELTRQEEEDGDRPPLGSPVEFVQTTTTTPGETMQGTADIGSCPQEQSAEDALVMEFGLLCIDEKDTIPRSVHVTGHVARPGVFFSIFNLVHG